MSEYFSAELAENVRELAMPQVKTFSVEIKDGEFNLLMNFVIC